MSKLKWLFLSLALVAFPALSADPNISGIGGSDGGAGYTTVKFAPAANGYAVTFDRLVVVFDREPPPKYLAASTRTPDSHGRGTVWLLSAVDHSELVNGAEFQLMGLGKEWMNVVKSAPIHGGSASVEMPYLGDNGWQLSTGRIILSDGTIAWASKGWPHKAYEAYDACGNPLNGWGAGRKNIGQAVTAEVRAIIKDPRKFPCPAGQVAKK